MCRKRHWTIPECLCVGEPWTYVQASRLKVHGTDLFLPVFELPDEGLQGLFAGAHRRRFLSTGNIGRPELPS